MVDNSGDQHQAIDHELSTRRSKVIPNLQVRTIIPLVPHPGESETVPNGIFISPSTACCNSVRVPHHTPRGLAPAIFTPFVVTSNEYPSDVFRPATSRNSSESDDNVRKTESVPLDAAVFTGTLTFKMSLRSAEKVSANSSSVGGMSVFPSVSLEFWKVESTTIAFKASNAYVDELVLLNLIVGIPVNFSASTILRRY